MNVSKTIGKGIINVIAITFLVAVITVLTFLGLINVITSLF